MFVFKNNNSQVSCIKKKKLIFTLKLKTLKTSKICQSCVFCHTVCFKYQRLSKHLLGADFLLTLKKKRTTVHKFCTLL